MKKLLIKSGLTLALTAGSMFGAQITQTQTFGSAGSPVNTDVGTAQTSQTFNYFQSAAGYVAGDILNSVTIDVTINETVQSLSIKNNDTNNSQTFTYTTSATYQLGGTDPDASAINTNYFDFHGVPAPFTLFSTGQITLAPNTTQNSFIGVPVTVTTDTGSQSAANPGLYNTTGTFTLGYITATSTTFTGGGGNLTDTQATTTYGTETIVYNYTAPSTGAPEPATMTLFGSALLGIGFFARKRIKKS